MAITKVTTEVITTSAVTTPKIADNAISAAKIPDGTIATGHIADNAVTAAKIPDNVLTATMLPDNVILATHIPNATAPTFANTTVTGTLTVGDGHTIGNDGDDNLVLTGSASENIIIDSADDIVLDAAGADINLKVAATTYGKFNLSGNNLNIHSSINDADIVFKGEDNSSTITALTLNMSEAGTAYFNSWVRVNDSQKIVAGDSSDLTLYHDATNSYITNKTGALKIATETSGIAVTIGHSTSETTIADNLTVTGNVGIGETAPANLLHVKVSDVGITPHASAQIALERSGTNYLQFLTAATGTSGILFGDTNDVDVSGVVYDHNVAKMYIRAETSDVITIDGTNRRVGIGDSSPDEKLVLKGDGARMLIESADYELFSIGRRASSGSGLDQGYLRMKAAGTNTIILDSAGDSYFNGGNVGIGEASPSSLLTIKNNGSGGTWPFRIFNSQDTDMLAGFYESSSGDGYHGMLYLNDGGGNTDVKLSTNGDSWFNGGNVLKGHASSVTQEVCQSGTTVSSWTPDIQINGSGNGGLSVSQWNTGNTASANLWLTKSSNGTIGTHGGLSQNEAIGRIIFSASDGSTFSNVASIEAFADDGMGSNDTPGRIEFKTTADGATTPTTRMTINNDGDLQLSNTVTNPASNFADVTGIGIKYSATVPWIEVSSDSTALQLGRTSTGGSGQIMAMRAAGTVKHSFTTTGYDLTGTLAVSGVSTFSYDARVSDTLSLGEGTAGANYAIRHLETGNFTHGTANLGVQILFGNIHINGLVRVEVTSSYSNQNAVGTIRREFHFGGNTGGSIWQTDGGGGVTTAIGATPDNWTIGTMAWDSGNSRYYLPIYHINSNGNSASIKVEYFTDYDNAHTVMEGLSVTNPATVTIPSNYDVRQNNHFESYTGLGNGDAARWAVAPLHIAAGSPARALIQMDADTVGGEAMLQFKADSTGPGSLRDTRIKSAIIFRRDDPGTRGTGNLHFCMNGDNNDINASTSHSRFAILANSDISMKCAANTPSASVVGWQYHDADSSNPWVKSAVNSTGGATHYQFYNANGAVGQIYTSGSATTFATSSDYRLKENLDYSWDATTLLKQLKPCKFNFKKEEDGSKPTLQGFLAHEVSNIVPGAVRYEKDAVDSNGDPEYQTLDHSKLIPLMVKTIQELEARLAALE